jgi:VanZ family protein
MRRIWTVLFLSFAIFIGALVLLKNSGNGGWFFALFESIPYHDKIGHFFLMGTLGFLAVAAVSQRLPWPPWIATSLVMVGVIAVIGLEEWSQQFFKNRSFSLLDFMFGAGGVVLLGMLAHLAVSSARKKKYDSRQ